MQYKILGETAIDGIFLAKEKLEKEVSEYLERGWEPVGGISISSSNAVFQAIIKK